jgi:hypothetical protein
LKVIRRPHTTRLTGQVQGITMFQFRPSRQLLAVCLILFLILSHAKSLSSVWGVRPVKDICFVCLFTEMASTNVSILWQLLDAYNIIRSWRRGEMCSSFGSHPSSPRDTEGRIRPTL